MNTNKRQYDLVCSLGGNCAAAFQLKYRDMRAFSLPFDWCYIENEKPVEYLCEGFADGFKNLALKENMKRLPGTANHAVIYQDTYSGYVFPNHFKTDEEKEYDLFYKKLCRRTERLINKIKNARKVLFILSTTFGADITCLEKLNECLTKLYPNVHFDFEAVSFACPRDEEQTIGNIHFRRCFRQQNLYDFHRTNYEWAFLDQILLSEKSHNKIPLLSIKAFGKKFRLNLEIQRRDDE